MNTFGRAELLSFFAEIDENLEEPAAIEIIGGAAALLAYGAVRPTKDVDCIGSLDAQIRRAAGKTKLRIPIDRAALADPPNRSSSTCSWMVSIGRWAKPSSIRGS